LWYNGGMRKALDKIRSNWKVLLVTIVAVVAICSFIAWIWDKYGQNYALMWVSLFIAVIVAIVALESLRITRGSLKTTRESLELTRATTRPFVTSTQLEVVFHGNEVTIRVLISNKGIHPADNVSTTIEQFTRATEDASEQILYSWTSPGSVFFPNEDLVLSRGVYPQHVDLIKNEKWYVRTTIDYQYKLTGTKHKTVQTGQIIKDKTDVSKLIFLHISEECYWT